MLNISIHMQQCINKQQKVTSSSLVAAPVWTGKEEEQTRAPSLNVHTMYAQCSLQHHYITQ